MIPRLVCLMSVAFMSLGTIQGQITIVVSNFYQPLDRYSLQLSRNMVETARSLIEERSGNQFIGHYCGTFNRNKCFNKEQCLLQLDSIQAGLLERPPNLIDWREESRYLIRRLINSGVTLDQNEVEFQFLSIGQIDSEKIKGTVIMPLLHVFNLIDENGLPLETVKVFSHTDFELPQGHQTEILFSEKEN